MLQQGWGEAGRVPRCWPGCPLASSSRGDIAAVRSSDAVIAQYGLGAALSCDALGWKEASSWEGDAQPLLLALWG